MKNIYTDILSNGRSHWWLNIIAAIDRTILLNSLWLALGEAVGKGAMFLATVLLIRYLSPTDFGHFSISNSLAVTAGMVIDFGLSTIVTRDLSGNLNKAAKYLSNVLSLKLLLGVFYLSFILMITFFPGFDRHDQWTMVLLLLAIFTWFQDLTGLFASLFVAEEKMEKLFFVQVIHYCGIAFAVLVTIHFQWRLQGLVTGYVLAASIGSAMAYFFVLKGNIRLSFQLDGQFLTPLFKRSLPLFGALALTTAYVNADTLIIGQMLGAEAVGFYQGAYKFLFVFQSINLLNTALFPRMSTYIKSGDSHAFVKLNVAVALFFLLFLLPVTLIAILFVKPLILFIYGEKMLPSIDPLRFMIPSGAVYFLRIYLGNILIAQDRQKCMFIALSTGLLFNIFLNVDLIPLHGVMIGGLALLLSEIEMCGVMLIFIRRESSSADIP
jgi:O-antigen/teichoic acid export membrane protein